MKEKARFLVSLGFEEVSLPPFRDILILGRKCPHGKVGISTCLSLLAPDDFTLLELEDPLVEAILVNKRILSRMPAAKIIEILREKVFPYIVKGEIVKVDFKVRTEYDDFEITLEEQDAD